MPTSGSTLRVRTRARARRPINDGNNIVQRPKAQRPSSSAQRLNTGSTTGSQLSSNDAFSSFPVKTTETPIIAEPVFPSFIPKQITEKPSPLPEVEPSQIPFAPTPIRRPVAPPTKRPNFAAFPAVKNEKPQPPRGLAAFASFAALSPDTKTNTLPVTAAPERNTKQTSFSAFNPNEGRNSEPILPTRPSSPIRQPERSFVPTVRPTESSRTGSGPPSRFASFPVQNSDNNVPSQQKKSEVQQRRPVAQAAQRPRPPVPSSISRPAAAPQGSRPVIRGPAIVVPGPGSQGPGTLNFDALIREFTGQQPASNVSPSLFNAIPIESSNNGPSQRPNNGPPQRPRQFRPQPAVPVTPASFQLFTEL